MKRQAAVFVTVPAEALVDPFRRRYHPRAIARRLPPHVTVVPPFFRDVEDDGLVIRFREHFVGFAPFAAELTSVGRFRRHAWLAPEPRDRFVDLLATTHAAFPDIVRDEGREPVPHLTIAELQKGQSAAEVVAAAEREVGLQLPLAFEVRDVALFDVLPEGWHEVCRFPFA